MNKYIIGGIISSGLWIAFSYVVNMIAQSANIDFSWGIIPILILYMAIVIGIGVPLLILFIVTVVFRERWN